MSERELQMSGVLETQQAAQGSQVTAGQLLRQAREAAGLHVAALASSLKVPVHKLEALEADDLAAFPDTVFMRALASSICRSLRLDAAPILDRLPRSEQKGFDSQRMHLNEPIKARAGKSGGGMTANSSSVSRKALWSMAGLLLAAGIVYFMPHGAMDDAVQEPASAPAAVEAPQSVLPEAVPLLPAVEVAPASVLPAAEQPAPVVPPAAVAAPAPAVAPSAAPAPQTPAAGADTSGALLAFSATATSWVQVKDARGAVVLQKNLNAGESAQVSAALPVSVVVGRPDVTTLQVRGQAFDLPAVARGNAARFEVK